MMQYAAYEPRMGQLHVESVQADYQVDAAKVGNAAALMAKIEARRRR